MKSIVTGTILLLLGILVVAGPLLESVLDRLQSSNGQRRAARRPGDVSIRAANAASCSSSHTNCTSDTPTAPIEPTASMG
jgi:hypothetical protein